MTISGCSTLPSPKDLPPAIKTGDICPPPQAFASWNDFTSQTKAMKGETAFQTAKRFRLAEERKNAAAQRLWMGLKRCREHGQPPEKPKPKSITEILIGGL